MKVYHGTNFEFNEFRLNANKNYSDKASAVSVFFTEEIGDCNFYGSKIIECQLDTDNYKLITDDNVSQFVNDWLSDLETNDPEEYEFQISTKKYENSSGINKGLELAIIDAFEKNKNGAKIVLENSSVWYCCFNLSNISNFKYLKK